VAVEENIETSQLVAAGEVAEKVAAAAMPMAMAMELQADSGGECDEGAKREEAVCMGQAATHAKLSV